jgi:hypothetical protein
MENFAVSSKREKAMSALKRFSILILMAVFAVSAAMGQSGNSQSGSSQSGNSNEEMSIEESYLQEAIELMIIRETSRSDSRDQKLIALEHIGNAIERGSTNEELRSALEYLSLEGTQNRTRQGGRLMNNFPDVRRQAARHLGSIGTKESKAALIRITTSDNEPMVLQEAIRSLGLIGLNDNNDAVSAVVWVANRNHNSEAPDSLLALSALETLERFAEQNKSIEPETIQLIARIMEGPYASPVKERARQVLINSRRYASQSSSSNQN